MRKIINDPADFVDEFLAGIVAAHPSSYRFASADGRAVVAANAPVPARVGIVTGGGSGHLPLFMGYVGEGLATGAAVGNVFSSPSPAQVLAATQAVDGGAGVLYLYGNYGGDIYNFDIAADAAASKGIQTRTVLGYDDILSAPEDAARTRRGVAGLVFAYKIAGASAARGDDLETVERFANAAVDGTRTAGVGLAPTILPAAGKPTFELAEGEMEVGVGIHGESGIRTAPIEPADAIADDLFDRMKDEVGVVPGARLAVLVNGLGATPLEELYVLYARIVQRITDAGATVVHNFIGEYATSLEMAGASISLLAVDDDLEELLAAPAYSPFWRPGSLVPALVPGAAASVGDDLPTMDVPVAPFESSIRSVVFALAEALPQHTDELRDLDAALGDGDLGVTVSMGVEAMAARVRDLPVNATHSALLQEVGMAFASANPSTFAALVGSGIVSASTSVDDTQPIDKHTALLVGQRVAESIARRGGAQPGDKTLLDVLSPALERLSGRVSKQEFDAFLQSQVEEVAALRSARGRAAWHQERSVGLRDPGSVAVAYALSAIVGAADSSI